MVSRLYSTKEASELAGASRQIIRTYTERYKDYFSSEVQAEPGQPRRFTEQDLKLIAYIYQQTGIQGQKHEQVQAALAAGALEQFDWQPPEESAEPGEVPPSTALVPVERLQAAHALMLDAQRREQEAIARVEAQAQQLREQAMQRERELQEQINQLLRELGHKEGEMEALKAKPKGFWQRLLGRDA